MEMSKFTAHSFQQSTIFLKNASFTEFSKSEFSQEKYRVSQTIHGVEI